MQKLEKKIADKQKEIETLTDILTFKSEYTKKLEDGLMYLKDHYEQQFDLFEKNDKQYKENQKVLEDHIKHLNGIIRFSWKAEEMGIDTKNDVIKFTAKEKLEFVEDYKVEINSKQLESGKRIESMTLTKVKPEEKQNDK